MNLDPKKAASGKANSATLEFQVRCGAFFRGKRIQAKKSAEEVASDLNIPVQTLRDYEAGKTGIPLHNVHSLSSYLNIPSDEIMVLFHELEESAKPVPLFERDIEGGKNMGTIIRAARRTLALTASDVAESLGKLDYTISEAELLNLESGEDEPSVDFWMRFCHLLHLPIDSTCGYSRWHHLSQVQDAIEGNEMRMPIAPEVMKALKAYKTASDEHREEISRYINLLVLARLPWPWRN